MKCENQDQILQSIDIERYKQLEEEVANKDENYNILEQKYVKTCIKLVFLAAENQRILNQGSDFELYRKYTT